MNLTISDVIKQLEILFPKHLAYDKDPIGLQIGHVNRRLTKVLVTLDVTKEIVEEAIEKGANLIVAHHPFIYRPLASINTNTPKGKVVELCIKHDICVYAMHTNFDIAKNGMNDCFAEALGLKEIQPLIPTKREPYSKIAIYVPTPHAKEIQQVMGEAGVGQIGAYSHCTFTTTGMGSFKPLEGSNPFIGQCNQIESVEEVKIEGIIPTSLVSHVISKIKAVHPYEEMAYDVYDLNVTLSNTQYGLGRIGQVEHPMDAVEYIQHVKQVLNVANARFIGNLNKKIKTVAVIGGSGSSYIGPVKAKKADLFITGDVGFHDAQDALDMGLNVLDVGHHAECIMKQHVANILNDSMGEIAIASSKSTEPFLFV
ncbi:MAG: Nif3-like dinuclear metal center hexameric protein [Turicibacter sp.]|nr:Nif3-like dinuclear metal center hexameric protein [Turicibacter sp.]